MELNVADALREIQFLRDSTDDLIDELASVAQVVEFSDGSVIFRQGDPASTMYLVVEGNVSLEICAPGVGCKRILTVGRGELLGWSPVLEQSRLTATARALSEVQAIAFNGQQVITICERNPRFGYWFMKRAALALVKRLNATRLQLLDVFGTKMPAAADERTAETKTQQGR